MFESQPCLTLCGPSSPSLSCLYQTGVPTALMGTGVGQCSPSQGWLLGAWLHSILPPHTGEVTPFLSPLPKI